MHDLNVRLLFTPTVLRCLCWVVVAVLEFVGPLREAELLLGTGCALYKRLAVAHPCYHAHRAMRYHTVAQQPAADYFAQERLS
ncbi:hypothetical protein JKP88DRAFT_279680 [Tribonema minus]|uniref:Uncharacterized protein n=1 Tax=Tribonema minus TaxID=303371 RepID=A0A836CDR9_9STRA|nr:hypothetical protein JKP88DRAFT_279680 [Tribonema minus]